jgi:hypothetical protein
MKKLLLITILLTGSLFAQVKGNIEVPYIPYKIKMGKGFGTVQANCLTCHSFGYVLNMGKESKSFWKGKIHKMIVDFKAPIKKKDQAIIANYLFDYYGNGKLK